MARLTKKPQADTSVNKEIEKQIKKFNKELPVEPKYDVNEPAEIESSRGLQMDYSDKIMSMRNAIKILPPNMVDESGRQPIANIKALCGFIITNEMLDDAYSTISEQA